jgi:uncharacterized protein (DUF488 family)
LGEPAVIDLVWTIGHGDRSFPDVERELVAESIATLVDVRSRPYSRHAPDFAKAALAEWCADASIHYRWLGEGLGGRPDDPALSLPSGKPDLVAMAASAVFLGGIEELVAVAMTSPTVILCAERDPAKCHRSTLIAPALEGRGFTVIHLLGEGRKVRHQSALPL